MNKVIKNGLLPLPRDPRDFSFGAVFKLPDLKELPDEFITAKPLKIKDQKNSDLCTAYALTAVSEDQEGIELNPEYQFAKIKQIMGDYESWGADLRSACKSAVKFGSLEEKFVNSIGLPQNPRNWNNWNAELDKEAEKHKKQSYFKIDGPYDTFDNIRVVMWLNRDKKQSILTGIKWRHSWTHARHGIIPKEISEETGVGHAFKIFGWKQINGEPYLTAQLSNGRDIGDNGVFYFPREVINQELKYGIYTFVDMPPQTAKYYLNNRIKAADNWLIRLLKLLRNLFYKLKRKL